MEKFRGLMRGFLGLSLMVLSHEFGHLLAGLLLGIPVERFAIFFPPYLFNLGRFFGVVVVVGALPLGGSVRVKLEVLESVDPLVRILFILAGPLASLLLAGFLLSLTAQDRRQELFQFPAKVLEVGWQVLRLLATFDWWDGLSGPIGFFKALFRTKNFWQLIGVMSLSFGVFNLLPVPPLDGGKVVLVGLRQILLLLHAETSFLSWEVRLNLAGTALLLLMVMVATYRDLTRD